MRIPSDKATCDVAGCHNEAKVNVKLRVKNVKVPLGDIYLDLCPEHETHPEFSVSPGDITLERVWY